MDSTSTSSVLFAWYMNKYIVYILLCDQKIFYVGVTKDIGKRLEEHKNKQVFFTKKFSDLKVVYQEDFSLLSEARKREKQLKGWSQAKKKALINNDLTLLKQLSKKST